MGLAASQARLLTITARKSDCEYKSMAYSHQKIALSRDMNIVSAQYEDALNQTKLVYDFYGTGDTSTQLSYGLLMQPSKLNDYMPSPITDPSGRIVLDAGLAAAAKAAGIPQEGFGTTPSSDIRNKFIQGLIDNGIVTQTIGESIMNVTYNPDAGLGSIDMIDYTTEQVTYDDFRDNYLSTVEFDFSDFIDSFTVDSEENHGTGMNIYFEGTYYGKGGAESDLSQITDITLDKILNPSNGHVILAGLDVHQDSLENHEDENPEDEGGLGQVIDLVGSSSYWDFLFEAVASFLDPTDEQTQQALEYAKRKTLEMVEYMSENYAQEDYADGGRADTSNSALTNTTGQDDNDWDQTREFAENKADDYIGYIYQYYKNDDSHASYALDLTNMTQAYLTYFAQVMESFDTEYVVNDEMSTSKLIDDNFVFNVVQEVDTSGDSVLIANFYDMLFNQIATKGWVENDKVNDNEYLEEMLQNGGMYISTIADDNYYYMGNYSTNSYIKEITDEEGIAQAEAIYNREKEKITYKENILDMKMKNLDTEISALTTEYDTVKSVISKNIEKTFKRYNA